MKKFLLAFFPLLSALDILAQSSNQTYFFQKDQSFTISIDNDAIQRSHIGRGVLKALGSGLLSHQVLDHAGSEYFAKSGKAQRGTSLAGLLASIGIGAVVSYKDFIHRDKSRTVAGYRIYNKDHKLIATHSKKNRRRHVEIKGVMPETGYIEPFVEPLATTFANKQDSLIASSAQIIVNLQRHQKKTKVSGHIIADSSKPTLQSKMSPSINGIVSAMSMTTTGECLGSLVFETNLGGLDCSFYDSNGNGQIDGMTYTDFDGTVVVVHLSEYTQINNDNLGNVMSDYNPSIWPTVTEYLDWWEAEVTNTLPPPPPINVPCSGRSTSTTSIYNNANISQQISNISSLAASQSLENAMSIGIGPNGQYVASNIVTGTTTNSFPPGFASADTINIASVHTHPSGGFDAPSPADLFYTINSFLTNPSYNITYAVAADGTVYALYVNNSSALSTFSSLYHSYDNLTGNSFSAGSILGSIFDRAYTASRGQGMNYNDAFAAALSVVLNQFDVGITLLKADSSGNFSPVTMNMMKDITGTTDQVIMADCN